MHASLCDGLTRALVEHDDQAMRTRAHCACLHTNARVRIGSRVSRGKHRGSSCIADDDQIRLTADGPPERCAILPRAFRPALVSRLSVHTNKALARWKE